MLFKGLQKAGARVEYTEYKGADHWVWVRTYVNPEVINWLFRQKKFRYTTLREKTDGEQDVVDECNLPLHSS